MVLLPGCPCCQSCGWPRTAAPDSVELVIEDVSARTLYVSGSGGSANVYVPSFSGTFSLSPASSGADNWYGSTYLYSGTSNYAQFQLGLNWNYGSPSFSTTWDVVLNIAARFYIDNVFVAAYGGDPRVYLNGVGGQAFGVRCVKSTLQTFNFKQITGSSFSNEGFGPAGYGGYQNKSISFESGCYLPGTAGVDILYRTNFFTSSSYFAPFYSPSSHTFPISTTYTDPDYGTTFPVIGFRLAPRIVSAKYIYGSDAIPFLADLSQSTCPEL